MFILFSWELETATWTRSYIVDPCPVVSPGSFFITRQLFSNNINKYPCFCFQCLGGKIWNIQADKSVRIMWNTSAYRHSRTPCCTVMMSWNRNSHSPLLFSCKLIWKWFYSVCAGCRMENYLLFISGWWLSCSLELLNSNRNKRQVMPLWWHDCSLLCALYHRINVLRCCPNKMKWLLSISSRVKSFYLTFYLSWKPNFFPLSGLCLNASPKCAVI